MSKKTAKSKGYRTFKKEKPFLTKKELYALIAICVVVLVAFIAFVSYDDGALKIKNNALVGVEDNWIVHNGGTVSAPRYFKLAEAGEIDGYTLSASMSYNDLLLRDHYYFPTTEDNPIEYISVSTTSIKDSSSANLGTTVTEALATLEGYTITTPLTEEKLGDTPYSCYAFTTEIYVEPEETEETEETVDEAAAEETTEAATEEAAAEETTEADTEEAAAEETTEETAEETTVDAVAEENAPNTFGQTMNAYVETAHDGCLLIHVVNETKSPEEFMSDDELKVILEQVIAAITLEKE